MAPSPLPMLQLQLQLEMQQLSTIINISSEVFAMSARSHRVWNSLCRVLRINRAIEDMIRKANMTCQWCNRKTLFWLINDLHSGSNYYYVAIKKSSIVAMIPWELTYPFLKVTFELMIFLFQRLGYVSSPFLMVFTKVSLIFPCRKRWSWSLGGHWNPRPEHLETAFYLWSFAAQRDPLYTIESNWRDAWLCSVMSKWEMEILMFPGTKGANGEVGGDWAPQLGWFFVCGGGLGLVE